MRVSENMLIAGAKAAEPTLKYRIALFVPRFTKPRKHRFGLGIFTDDLPTTLACHFPILKLRVLANTTFAM